MKLERLFLELLPNDIPCCPCPCVQQFVLCVYDSTDSTSMEHNHVYVV